MKRALLLLLAAACVIGFVRLGFWQLDRAKYKETLLAQSQHALDARGLNPLAAVADRPAPGPDDNPYMWAVGIGHFLPLPAVLLDNQMRDGHVGVRVYRVFQPVPITGPGGLHPVLIELGWRPLPADRKLPIEQPMPGRWRVQGLFSPPPAAGIHLGNDAVQPQSDGALLVMRLDPAQIAQGFSLPNGLAPRVLRLDPAMKIGYVRDLDVLSGAMSPDRHRGYAVQWFGMAAGLFVVTLVVARRKPKSKQAQGNPL